jgi:hypothetical protein
MKPSNTWFALILIASALLLSGAKLGSANAQSGSPATRNEQQSQSAGQPSGASNPPPAPAAPKPSLTISVSPPQTAAAQSNPEDWGQRLYNHVWPPLWKTFFPPIWSNWGLIIAASIAAAVALKTLTAINRSNRVALKAARATRIAAVAGKESADTARKALLLQFRPRIRVRNIVIQPIELIIGEPAHDSILVQGYPVVGQFYIVNVGGTDATVIEVHAEVTWQYFNMPMKRPYEGKTGIVLCEPITLKSGQSIPWPFGSTSGIDINPGRIIRPEQWSESTRRPRRLYVLGFVVYADALGFERRTAFCRYLDPAIRRFVAVRDADYEHVE